MREVDVSIDWKCDGKQPCSFLEFKKVSPAQERRVLFEGFFLTEYNCRGYKMEGLDYFFLKRA